MENRMGPQTLTVRAAPSLALIKYWGKSDALENLPATSSLAITLSGLHTETTVSFSNKQDSVRIDGREVSMERFAPFFQKVRAVFRSDARFHVESRSNFPASAGLASSSSGFAALALGCSKLIDPNAEILKVAELARLGSASASRALFEGFTILKKQSRHAEPLFPKSFWPELRVIVAIVKNEAKKISSRNAMELAKESSPLYQTWLQESDKLFESGLVALKNRDLEALGPLIRQSTLMMFSTMFTSSPPSIYWMPDTIALLHACEALRELGFSAWETMDAGPQVKIVALEKECPEILTLLQTQFPHLRFFVSQAGESAGLVI